MSETTNSKHADRFISLIQSKSDKEKWNQFLDEVNRLKYVAGKDYFPNRSGNSSSMFKSEVANDAKVKKLKEKYGVTSFGVEKTLKYIPTMDNKLKILLENVGQDVDNPEQNTFSEDIKSKEHLKPLLIGEAEAKTSDEVPFEDPEDINENPEEVDKIDSDMKSAILEKLVAKLGGAEDVDEETINIVSTDIAEAFDMEVDEARTIVERVVEEVKSIEDESEDFENPEDETSNGTENFENETIEETEEFTEAGGGSDPSPEDDQDSFGEATELGEDVELSLSKSDNIDPNKLKALADKTDVTLTEEDEVTPIQEHEEIKQLKHAKNYADVLKDTEYFTPEDFKPLNEELLRDFAESKGIEYTKRRETIEKLFASGRIMKEDIMKFRDMKVITESNKKVKRLIESTSGWMFPEAIDFRTVEGRFDLDVETNPEAYHLLEEMPEEQWLMYQDELASCGVTVEYDSSEDVYKFSNMTGQEDEYDSPEDKVGGTYESLPEDRYPIDEADQTTVKNIVESKGYKFLEARGFEKKTNKPHMMEVIVEKAGQKTVIHYNDACDVQPWSIKSNGFQFLQEALESIIVSMKTLLAEEREIVKRELKVTTSKEKLLKENSSRTKNLPKEVKDSRDDMGRRVFLNMFKEDLQHQDPRTTETITDTLPDDIDDFLKTIVEATGDIDFATITEFAECMEEHHNRERIYDELRELKTEWDNCSNDETCLKISNEVAILVRGCIL